MESELKGLEQFAGASRIHSALQMIDPSNNNGVGTDRVLAIAEALTFNSSLDFIHLYANHIGSEAKTELSSLIIIPC
jgi:hypothetical protein